MEAALPHTMNNTIARQWEILRVVPKMPKSISSRELKDKLNLRGFDVSKRTVERDLRELSNIFPLGADESGQTFKWYWLKNMENEFAGISLDEAISLSLADDVLHSTLPDCMINTLKDKFELSNKKLENLEDLSVLKLRKKFRYIAQSLPFKKVYVAKNIIDSIQNALAKDVQLKIKYDAKDKDTKEHILNPLGLIQVGVRSYLIATVEGYETPLKFALQRIRQSAILDTKSKTPKKWSLDEYIASDAMQFGDCEEIAFKANISETLATYLEESAISKDQKIRYIDGSWQITATLKNSWQLWLWIRSQGFELEVLSPQFLRDDLIASLKASLARYE